MGNVDDDDDVEGDGDDEGGDDDGRGGGGGDDDDGQYSVVIEVMITLGTFRLDYEEETEYKCDF